MAKFSIDYILNEFVDMPVLEPEEPFQIESINVSENTISANHVKSWMSSLNITYLESDWRW